MAKTITRRVVRFADFFIDDTSNGLKIPQSEYATFGRNLIIDQGNNEVAGYSDRNDGLYTSVPAVVFGDHTRIIKYIDNPFFIGADGVKILKPQNGVNPKYAYYALIAARIDSLGYSRHFKLVKELRFILPPLAEQKRIVAVLDKISEMKRNAEARLQKLDLLVKARFDEMFGDNHADGKGWREVSFDEVARIDGRMENDFERFANYPHIGIDSIIKGTGELTGYRTVAEDGVISGKYHFTSRHIIYSKIRPNLNKVALPDFEGLCSADAYAILPSENIERVYLACVLRSKDFLEYIIPLSRRTGMPKANRRQIQGFKFLLPPLSLQRKFVAFVEKIEALKATVKKQIEQVDLLYRSRLQEYFS